MRVFPRLALRIDAAADGRKYSMALRIKTKWNSKGPKTLADRASVVGVYIWRASQEACKRMEKDEFSLGSDQQFVAVLTEMVAFSLQVTDRIIHGQMSEDDRRTVNLRGRAPCDDRGAQGDSKKRENFHALLLAATRGWRSSSCVPGLEMAHHRTISK